MQERPHFHLLLHKLQTQNKMEQERTPTQTNAAGADKAADISNMTEVGKMMVEIFEEINQEYKNTDILKTIYTNAAILMNYTEPNYLRNKVKELKNKYKCK
jgi:accessory colonization factor AcfC